MFYGSFFPLYASVLGLVLSSHPDILHTSVHFLNVHITTLKYRFCGNEVMFLWFVCSVFQSGVSDHSSSSSRRQGPRLHAVRLMHGVTERSHSVSHVACLERRQTLTTPTFPPPRPPQLTKHVGSQNDASLPVCCCVSPLVCSFLLPNPWIKIYSKTEDSATRQNICSNI